MIALQPIVACDVRSWYMSIFLIDRMLSCFGEEAENAKFSIADSGHVSRNLPLGKRSRTCHHSHPLVPVQDPSPVGNGDPGLRLQTTVKVVSCRYGRLVKMILMRNRCCIYRSMKTSCSGSIPLAGWLSHGLVSACRCATRRSSISSVLGSKVRSMSAS